MALNTKLPVRQNRVTTVSLGLQEMIVVGGNQILIILIIGHKTCLDDTRWRHTLKSFEGLDSKFAKIQISRSELRKLLFSLALTDCLRTLHGNYPTEHGRANLDSWKTSDIKNSTMYLERVMVFQSYSCSDSDVELYRILLQNRLSPFDIDLLRQHRSMGVAHSLEE